MTDFFETIRRLFQPTEADQTNERNNVSTAQAATVILLELAMADDAVEDAERVVIEQAIMSKFGLAPEQLTPLLVEAQKTQQQATSMHDFTRLLRSNFSPEQRGELMEWLWRVAYADGRLDPYEEQLIRRLADLIGVSPQEMIRRKHQAQRAEQILVE